MVESCLIFHCYLYPGVCFFIYRALYSQLKGRSSTVLGKADSNKYQMVLFVYVVVGVQFGVSVEQGWTLIVVITFCWGLMIVAISLPGGEWLEW